MEEMRTIQVDRIVYEIVERYEQQDSHGAIRLERIKNKFTDRHFVSWDLL
jgi:hypothetical protein